MWCQIKLRMLSVILFFAILGLLCPVGRAAEPFAGGNGTPSDPYLISTPEDLLLLSDQVNSGTEYLGSYFKITRNLDLSGYSPWPSIGTRMIASPVCSFQGILDGDGHTITGLSINGADSLGLFGSVGQSGMIHDLVLDGFELLPAQPGFWDIGGLVSYNLGTVANCGNIGEMQSGSLIGNNSGVVFRCYNQGTVTGGSGLVMTNAGEVLNCRNDGPVIDGGGLVSSNTGRILGCVNTASVKSMKEDTAAGGIVQENQDRGGGLGGVVADCSNSGDVTAVGGYSIQNMKTAGSGGIAGINDGNIIGCRNIGRIIATGFQSAAGGIAAAGGSGSKSAGTVARIVNCSNAGPVSIMAIQDDTSNHIGGIIGYNGKWSLIENCHNEAGVEGSLYDDVGGVAGFSQGGIYNCVNTGTIKVSESSAAGGITGETEAGEVFYCYNLGDIFGTADDIGGVTGLLHCRLVMSFTENCHWAAGTAATAIGFQQDDSVVYQCTPFSDQETFQFFVENTTCTGLLNALNTYVSQDNALLTWELGGGMPVLRDSGDDLAVDGTLPFQDVTASNPYCDSISYVYENGLMAGTGEDCFSPDTPVTRSMLVTLLYRAAGSPSTSTGISFSDVPFGSWYEIPVRWASEHKIVSGYSSDKFGAEDPLTYEQLAVILYRYASDFDYLMYPASGGTSSGRDWSTVSSWALKAVCWGDAMGLLEDNYGAPFAPDAVVCRAEMAHILALFHQNALSLPKSEEIQHIDVFSHSWRSA